MKTRTLAKSARKLLSALLIFCLVLPSLPARTVRADAAAYYYDASGAVVTASASDAFSQALSLGTGMGITADWYPGSRLIVSNGKTIFIEMNGHVISRNRTSYTSNGEVFYLEENANLTVYGGTRTDPAAGKDTAHTLKVWVTDDGGSLSQTERTLYGAVIHGGYSSNHAGGIDVRKNATLTLSYVTLAGNRAEQNWGTDGYGGGVMLADSYAKLNLDHANIVYNYAYNDGGGVFVNGGTGRTSAEYCRIRMSHSHIDYNNAQDNGGGLSVKAKYFTLVGDAVQIEDSADFPSEEKMKALCYSGTCADTALGSTIACNTVVDSDTGSGGGGVIMWSDEGTVNGVNVIGNRVLNGGNGGGIFTDEENINVISCNVCYNTTATQKVSGVTVGGYGGGLYINNDLTTVTDCTVFGNRCVQAGAGVYVHGMVDLIIGGLIIVQENTTTAGTPDNLRLGHSTGLSAYLICSGLDVGSLINVSLDDSHDSKIACGSSSRVLKVNAGETIDQRMFAYDNNQYYLYWNSRTNPWYDSSISIDEDRDSSSYNLRWLLREDISLMPEGYSKDAAAETVEFVPDAGSELKAIGSYTVGDVDYGLYRGASGMQNVNNSTDNITMNFIYSDGFFMEDPAVYNEHLASLSLCLAAAAGYSNTGNEGAPDGYYETLGSGSTYYPLKTVNIVDFLSDIGVAEEDIFLNDFNYVKPTTTSMGVAIGSKAIGDKTLVIIGTRGTGYEAEWASNVSIGSSGEAEGFSSCAAITLEALQSYLASHGIDGFSENTIFWISGYSRAGATANLTAKRIIDTYDNGGARTFAYTIESPKGGLTSELVEDCNYDGIHNVINAADLVPYVAPTEMGFIRYGVDHYVPGGDAGEIVSDSKEVVIYNSDGSVAETFTAVQKRDNEQLSADAYAERRLEMVRQLFALDSDFIYDDYFYQATLNFVQNTIYGANVVSMVGEVDSNSPTYTNGGIFIPAFLASLEDLGFNYNFNNSAKTDDYRYFYSEAAYYNDVTFQQALAVLVRIAFSLDKESMDGLMEVFGNILYRLNTSSLYLTEFLDSSDDWTTYSSYADIHGGEIDELMDEIWTAVATSDDEKGYKSLYDVLDASMVEEIHGVWKSLMLPLLYFAHMDYAENDSDILGTLVYNVGRLLYNHYLTVVYAFLRADDSYFAGGVNDSYKTIVDAQSSVYSPTLSVRVNRTAADGTVTSETILKENFGTPITLASENDNLELLSDMPLAFYTDVSFRIDGFETGWLPYGTPLDYEFFRAGNYLKKGDDGNVYADVVFHAAGTGLESGEASVRVIISDELLKPAFKSYSVLLSGKIGVVFYVDLPDIAWTDYSDSYVTFTVQDETQTAAFNPQLTSNNGRYYGFIAYVNSIQMAEQIGAVFHYGENSIATSHSVKDYIQGFETIKDRYSQKTIDLVEALADYGHHVQPYLSALRGWTIGEDYAEMDLHFTESYSDLAAVKQAVSEHACSIEGSCPAVQKFSYSLCLDSGTSVHLYVTPKAGDHADLTFTVDGVTVTADSGTPVNLPDGCTASAVTRLSGQILLSVDGISAHRLGNLHSMTVSAGSDSCTIKLSALSYLNSWLTSGGNEQAGTAAAALYHYYEAALAYLS